MPSYVCRQYRETTGKRQLATEVCVARVKIEAVHGAELSQSVFSLEMAERDNRN